MEDTPLLRKWRQASALPGGRFFFSLAVGLTVPYARTIRPQVLDLAPGWAQVSIRDRRRVRNHLRSIHAIALVNLGEMTANLALSALQPKNGRWIVTGVEADYSKKARGTITAESRVEALDWSRPLDTLGECILRDEAGDVVTVVRPRWRLGPKVS